MAEKFSVVALFLLLQCSSLAYAQIGVDNSDPHPSSVLDLSSTDKGLLIPRMTTVQREAIVSPANSLLVYDITLNNYFYYYNGQWQTFSPWGATGSDIYYNSGNVGIGTVPSASHSNYNFQFLGSAITLMAAKNVNEGYFASNVYYDTDWKKRIADESSMIQQNHGAINFYTHGSGSAGSTISWGDPKLSISNGGSVSVYDELMWNGNNSGNARALKIGYSGGNYGAIGYGVDFTSLSDTWNYAVADRVSLIDFRNGGFRFHGTPTVGGVGNPVTFGTLMDISNAANVGIGGYADGDYKMTLHDDGGGAQLKFMRGSGVATITQDNNQNNLYVDAPGNLLLNYGGGNVGIGLTPGATLDVVRGTATWGTAVFRGTANHSHFNYSTNEDTYIRGGKAASLVYINDASNGNVQIASGGGNVGIGGAPESEYDFQVFNNGSTNALIGIKNSSTGEVGLLLERTSGAAAKWEMFLRPGTTHLRFWSSGFGDLFTFSTAGVGTGSDWVATSDRRLKANIREVGSQLQKISSIGNLVRNYDRTDTKKNETGFIAQELAAVAPEYVNVPEDPKDMQSVNYAKMVVPLYKGTTELADEVQRLRKELSDEAERSKDASKKASDEIEILKKEIQELKALLKKATP